MKTKIFVVLFVFLLAAGSLVIAGDQKPFEGYAQAVGDPTLIDPFDYPYLAEVISENSSLTPVLITSQLQGFQGNINVGGKSTWENAQLYYFYSTAGPFEDPLEWLFYPFFIVIYEDSTITVANGDQIFIEVEGIYYSVTDKWITTDTVIGGTGRFEGAEGSIKVTPGLIKKDQSVAVFEGYIETVGEAEIE